MKGRAQRLRAVALLAAGAAAVHQLRYAIGFGHDARHALAAQGHGYLDLVLPFVAAVGLFALAAMLRAPLAGARDRRASLARSWATTAIALVAAYVAQELLEGLLASGHPGGLEYARARVRACAPPRELVLPRPRALTLPSRGAIRLAPARAPPLLPVS